ncbi:ABC transporter substrate-binding protein [Pseudooceanicola sp. CBS1P-1]|uniref:ABC transporter substrate-binding protein n=1 Tax=Pseudooceanicola albus TaxID=2692189 RepID=A0A6L7G4F8_9RHOB|nr:MULTISPECIES: ABC transporter substrate-binding protein [Pseudooceanicola]MBT9385260.1 ABC transporter substrate-binding protein [Pseudooceanicola endophyticus]MXN18881.1 ABC transporter substrate-binding protein [Pseudooceanicola albus]
MPPLSQTFGSLLRAGAVAAVSTLALATAPQAADLTIGLKSEPTSLDPQFHVLASNTQVSMAIFEPLVAQNTELGIEPDLATSWTFEGTVWTFNLDPAVTFSDGTPFTADDVVFSIDRVAKVPNSPSPFTLFTRQIASVEAVDAHTVKITTKEPYPLLVNDLAYLPILSKAAASGPAPEGRTTTELNRGEGLIGTGPYKFQSWERGASLVLARNDAFHGAAPEWDHVVYKPMVNPASRAAALLAGDIDVMEAPPTTDLKDMEANPKVSVVAGPPARVLYVGLDQFRDATPGVKGTAHNPFLDIRVREAMSLAIDRKAIVARVMGGAAQAAGDLVPATMFGADPGHAEAPAADIARAKALLAEAGYAKGFDLVLGAPSGRYVNDARIAQTLAAMWSRIGIRTTVEASTPSVFFKNYYDMSYSAYLASWGNNSGEVGTTLKALVLTRDPAKGIGTANNSGYANPEVDKLVLEGASTMDPEAREALLAQADKIVLDDYTLLPLHFEQPLWALRAGLTYAARADQYTLPQDVHSVK